MSLRAHRTPTIQAVITDWCGTVESNVQHRLTIIKDACLESDLPEPSQADCQAISGMTAVEALAFLQQPDWTPAQCQALANRLSHSMTTNSRTLILEQKTISWLASRNISLSLFTNSTRPIIDRNLAKYQLKDCFRYIATSDVYPAKPRPDMLIAIQKMLQLPAKSCLVIGDHVNDCLAANQAGMPCVITLTGVLKETDFREILPQPLKYCIDINELPGVIQDIQNQDMLR